MLGTHAHVSVTNSEVKGVPHLRLCGDGEPSQGTVAAVTVFQNKFSRLQRRIGPHKEVSTPQTIRFAIQRGLARCNRPLFSRLPNPTTHVSHSDPPRTALPSGRRWVVPRRDHRCCSCSLRRGSVRASRSAALNTGPCDNLCESNRFNGAAARLTMEML